MSTRFNQTLMQEMVEVLRKHNIGFREIKNQGGVTTAIAMLRAREIRELFRIRAGKLSGEILSVVPPVAIFSVEVQQGMQIVNPIVKSWQISRFRGDDNRYVHYLEGIFLKNENGTAVLAVELTDERYNWMEAQRIAEEVREFYSQFIPRE